MIELKNRDDLIYEIADLLLQFEVDQNRYETDIYLYIDDDGNGTLDTFVNPGGHSWLNDDHFCLYEDKPEGHCSLYEVMPESYILDELGLDKTDIPEGISLADYIEKDWDLSEKLKEIYRDCLIEGGVNYLEQAAGILEEFEKEQKFEEENR